MTPSSSSTRFEIPPHVGRLLARLPAAPGAWLFATGLNAALASQLPGDVAQALCGRHLRLRVRDAHIAFDFTWAGQAFAPRGRRTEAADLTIAANAADLLALARREQDPDTLFFSRRLVMEGDTELGLMVKNALDAMALPVLDTASLRWPSPRQALLGLQQLGAALRASARAAREDADGPR